MGGTTVVTKHAADIASIHAIESVQQHFTKRISGFQHLHYYDRLRYLQLQSLQRRRERYIIIYMWKIRHSLCPNDLQISFSENNLRLGPLAVIPRLHTSSRAKFQTLYNNSFAVVGPKLWNLLPANVKSEDTITFYKLIRLQSTPSVQPSLTLHQYQDIRHRTETPC